MLVFNIYYLLFIGKAEILHFVTIFRKYFVIKYIESLYFLTGCFINKF